MPLGSLDGVGLGCKASVSEVSRRYSRMRAWLGRVVNALGEPIDGKGPLLNGKVGIPIRNPPPAHSRRRVGGKIDLGVRAMNAFLTCCRGQRMGIFAGSGVGKSVLMSMLARDVGRRQRHRPDRRAWPRGAGVHRPRIWARTAWRAASSSSPHPTRPPLMRRQSAYMTMSIAEYFRDQGKNVMCMMDSVTRFAMAQREIGLSAGEPPTTKGYPPTTFAELPRLLERAGPGIGDGNITGLFTVLVDGDDHNEPIADAVRGILDGHIVMERAIGERGRYPAINILRSVSRTMPGCNTDNENALVGRARRLLSAYNDMAEMIRLGAYRPGSDPLVDEAIEYNPAIEEFLKQGKRERTDMEAGYAKLAEILNVPWP